MDIKYQDSNYSTTINIEINPRSIIKKGLYFGLAVIVITFSSLMHLDIDLPFSPSTIGIIMLFIIFLNIWLKQKKLSKFKGGFIIFEDDTLEIRDRMHQHRYNIKEIIEVKEINAKNGFSSITLRFNNTTAKFDSDHPKYEIIRKAIFEWIYNNIENHEDIYKEEYK